MPPRYVTKPARSTQPGISPGSLNRVPTSIGWGKGGWQVTLCDPVRHVNSRIYEACYIIRLLYLTFTFTVCCVSARSRCSRKSQRRSKSHSNIGSISNKSLKCFSNKPHRRRRTGRRIHSPAAALAGQANSVQRKCKKSFRVTYKRLPAGRMGLN